MTLAEWKKELDHELTATRPGVLLTKLDSEEVRLAYLREISPSDFAKIAEPRLNEGSVIAPTAMGPSEAEVKDWPAWLIAFSPLFLFIHDPGAAHITWADGYPPSDYKGIPYWDPIRLLVYFLIVILQFADLNELRKTWNEPFRAGRELLLLLGLLACPPLYLFSRAYIAGSRYTYALVGTACYLIAILGMVLYQPFPLH